MFARILPVIVATLAIVLAAQADAPKHAAPVLRPVKLTAAEARGPVFQRKGAIRADGADGPTVEVNLLKSRDGRFEAGVFTAGPSDQPVESYEEDEFMYFLEGGVTLTSADGSVLEVRAGDGLMVPKGWKGRWTTKGYKKYYAVYQSDPTAK
jgi:uncharacterized cupin superfamily protein